MPSRNEKPNSKPVVLCILDGWGENPKLEDNAVRLAKTPVFDRLQNIWPSASLSASGPDVGLPEGQIGNSEVGHLNIGAGRLVLQTLPRISKAISDEAIEGLPAFQKFVKSAESGSRRVHLLGLLSPGGVHAHTDHAVYLVKLLKSMGFEVCLHAFSDGRDGPAKEIADQILSIESEIDQPLTTLIGRYYSMDRDKRWERTKRAFDLLVSGQVDTDFGQSETEDFVTAIRKDYDIGSSDEFLKGMKQPGYEGFQTGDVVLAFNLRADRMRQLLSAFVEPDFSEFPATIPVLNGLLGMISYADSLSEKMGVLFERETIQMTLGEVVAEAGITQIRAAETEKYPHVTYFLNGGREAVFDKEERLMVPSPKVATYDLQPAMSARELTEKLLTMMSEIAPGLVVVNYANPDMVGHTGDLKAAIVACETVDTCLGQLEEAVMQTGGQMLIIADHGNCEVMKTDEGKPHTAHTLNPVPVIAVGGKQKLREGGCLADVAPTLLDMMQIAQPSLMDGLSLLTEKP